MPEQTATTETEQAWLGNQTRTVEETATLNRQAYLPDGHRIAPPKLTPPTDLRTRPVIAMTHPYDVTIANILLRKSVTAAGKFKLARQAAKQAEDAMTEALAAEALAEHDSVEADRELLNFAREAADQ